MTIRSEIIALLDPMFARRVSGDVVPRGGLDYPNARVLDHLTEGVALRGNRRAMAWRRTVQVDVFQRLDDEDPVLLDEVLAALDGAAITGAMHLSVVASLRSPDPDPGVVHHAITCSLARLR